MPFGSRGPSKFVHVSCVSASSPKCIVRESWEVFPTVFFGNFRAEIVALHIIQLPHDFGTKTNQRTCPCNRKTLQLYSQSTSCCSETTGNRATEKVLGTRSFTLELQSRPAIISVMAELFNEWKKKKKRSQETLHTTRKRIFKFFEKVESVFAKIK